MLRNQRHRPLDPISPNIVPPSTTTTITHPGAKPSHHAQTNAPAPTMPPPTRPPRSGSTTSGSDLQLAEDDTEDSFGRKMIREMQAEAASNWRAANRPVAFRKARIRPRAQLTAENLENVAGGAEGLELPGERGALMLEEQAQSVTSSGGSRASDPPLNVPRQWGRKSRKNHEWLKRITMEPNQLVKETPKPELDPVDWEDVAASIALPQDSPTSRRSSRRGTPAAAIKPNTSIEEIQQRELEDLTLGSLITSTPAPRSRNTRLEEIRRLELESALEEVLEDSKYPTPPPEDQPPKVTQSRRVPAESAVLEAPFEHPAEQQIQIPKRVSRRRSSVERPRRYAPKEAPKEAPRSPIKISRSAHTVGQVDRVVQPDIQKSPERPVHRREDSQDILRRLSRAASGTPSPAPARQISQYDAPRTSAPEQNTRDAETEDVEAAGVARREARRPQSSSTRVEREQIEQEDLRIGHRSQPAPGTNRYLSPPKRLEPRTPVVTGAWIDTPVAPTNRLAILNEPKQTSEQPAPVRKQTSPVKANSKDGTRGRTAAPLPPTGREPRLPPSALAAVVGNARSQAAESQNGLDALGDATIASLEDIIAAPAGDFSMFTEDSVTAGLVNTPEPRTAAERQRAQEVRTLKEMNRRLVAARRGMHDAGVGIQRVEKMVGMRATQEHEEEHAAKGSGEDQRRAARSRNTSVARIVTDGLTFAQHPFLTLWTGVKRMFLYKDQEDISRLTWFGLISAVSLVWLLSETTACAAFCRPIYSTSYNPSNAYSLYPSAPEFPTVLPTLLYRLLDAIPVLSQLIDLIYILCNVTLGEAWRTYVIPAWTWFYQDENVHRAAMRAAWSGARKVASASAAAGARVVSGGGEGFDAGLDWSMAEDEYL